MWIIALLFGFGIGGLCEYFRRERELRRQHAKVGTPSASHNSAITPPEERDCDTCANDCKYRDEAADMWPCEDCCHCGNNHFTQRT
jgi:hypothetical protein